MKEEILKLKDGQSYTVPESDYGKAEIWLKNGVYFLFSIPMFGGEPNFEKEFYSGNIDGLIDTINSWT